MANIDRDTAARIAEGMNTWAGEEYRRQIITADEVLNNLFPIAKHADGGYDIYAYQWGDVTILACLFGDIDGSRRIMIKTIFW